MPHVTRDLSTKSGQDHTISFPSDGILGGSQGFIGEISEFILFERTLSDPERSAVRAYFNSKFNLWTP
jgi:hypothetical protein